MKVYFTKITLWVANEIYVPYSVLLTYLKSNSLNYVDMLKGKNLEFPFRNKSNSLLEKHFQPLWSPGWYSHSYVIFYHFYTAKMQIINGKILIQVPKKNTIMQFQEKKTSRI